MKPGPFRFQVLLTVYENQEEVIMQEISVLENERKAIERSIRQTLEKCREIRDEIGSEESAVEAGMALQCINALMRKREQRKIEQEEMGQKVLAKREELMDIRRERMRFQKLKDRHQKECQRYLKLLEQKESDDFSQRKRSRQDI